jgi:hypothetical protein
MSLPATLILATHVLLAVFVVSPAFVALFTRTLAPMPKKAALIFSALAFTTGLQNFISVMGDGVPKQWHMMAGIKVLLGLHILVVSVLAADPSKPEAKRLGLYRGVAFSAVAVILIGVILGYVRVHG